MAFPAVKPSYLDSPWEFYRGHLSGDTEPAEVPITVLPYSQPGLEGVVEEGGLIPAVQSEGSSMTSVHEPLYRYFAPRSMMAKRRPGLLTSLGAFCALEHRAGVRGDA